MKRMILGWLAAGIMAVPMSAQALLVTVEGQAYEVETISGTYLGLATTLNAQPWWGKTTLAEQFASAVNDDLGLPNFSGTAGPLFAFLYGTSEPPIAIRTWGGTGTGFAVLLGTVEPNVTYTWATASPVPLPPALYLLGLGFASLLGLGARRRRQATPA